MRIDIITILPELLRSPFEASIMKRAIDKGLVEVHFHNLRDYTTNKQKSVDDYPFGGGAGMVMMAEPWGQAIDSILEKDGEIGKDDLARGEKELEKITSDHVAKIDELLKHKEVELLEV